MKLLRYGPVGQEKPGIVDSHGRIRSLSPAVQDLTPEVISPEGLKILAALDVELGLLAEIPGGLPHDAVQALAHPLAGDDPVERRLVGSDGTQRDPADSPCRGRRPRIPAVADRDQRVPP